MNISLINESSRITKHSTLECKIVRILSRNEVMTSDGAKKVTDVIFEDDSGDITGVIWHNNDMDKKVMLHDDLLITGGFGKKYGNNIKLVVNKYSITRRS